LTLNKKDIMRQPSLRALLEALVEETPGIESQKLWGAAKQWDSNLSAGEFDAELESMLGQYRVTAKKWYRATRLSA
jgi:hypothetical protein